ncbi:MAG: hypothetical protein FJ319_11650 [SAR202 cluster bacterium]|nr:hypothetical protein [SAR202 cluster bacterium]
MRLFLTGCEYSGTTTLSKAIAAWAERTLGPGKYNFHDHWKLPDIKDAALEGTTDVKMTDEDKRAFMGLTPNLKAMFSRYNIEYHLNKKSFYARPDHQMIGWAIDDAIYGPKYYDYGHKGTTEDREYLARRVEREVMEKAPDAVHVLVKASPEVIRRRMEAEPREYPVVRDADVEYILGKFEEQFEASHFKNKMVIDTTAATVEASLAEFVAKFDEFMTPSDRGRMSLQSKQAGKDKR